MDDVIVVGAGPAGALAALILARAGLRVRVFDRSRFPRAKLCGDTLNPGALRILQRHVDTAELRARSLPISGMLLTGPNAVAVPGRYANGVTGLAITRHDFDAWLVAHARAAGAVVEEQTRIVGVVVEASSGRVNGVRVNTDSRANQTHNARLVIAADGRRSVLAFELGLARQPQRPRRWAIGAYFENVAALSDMGEMHVRPSHYLGVAPLPDGIANACLVVPHHAGADRWGGVSERLLAVLAEDCRLRERFAAARMIGRPMVLGPMAVDVTAAGRPGLLLAGDAAGFIDPMTGDGLRLALEGSTLAARTALAVFGGQVSLADSVDHLTRARRAAFAAKWRFNRTLRALVGSSRGVSSAAFVARALPSLFATMINYAGDCEKNTKVKSKK